MTKSFTLLLTLIICGSLNAQISTTPQGFYFKVGGDTPNQYFEVRQADEENYQITDIYGRGFSTNFNDGLATINSQQQITVNNNQGATGYTLNRVVETDSDFPLNPNQSFSTNPLFAGDFNISELLLDSVTGEVLQQFDGSFEFIDVFTLAANSRSLRFSDSNNIYFQGVMIGSDQVAFRVIFNPAVPRPIAENYESLIGSVNNFGRDNVGNGQFTDINHFDVLLAVQVQEGESINQFLLKISGSRVNPLPVGDVNGDYSKNEIDRDLIAAALGQVKNQDDLFNIASDLNQDGIIDFLDLAIFDGETVTEKAVSSTMTALWFDPAHDGEGWDLQILSDSLALLSWYTYDEEGKQIWTNGIGTIDGNSINFPELRYATTGTTFGSTFNSDELVFETWGSANMRFQNCNNAKLSYSSARFGTGSLSPTRINLHSGLDCENGIIDSNSINLFSGIWFDPSHDGEGWVIQTFQDNRAVVTWYSYDENAQLMWMIGVGTITENTLTVESLSITEGGIFGTAFDPTQVQRSDWGSMQFIRNGCHQGEISYAANNEAMGSGSLNATRLGGLAALSCTD